MDAGIGYMRAVSGKVDALSRLPIVIGYGEETTNASDGKSDVRVGWLFGPRMEVDEKSQTIRLVHRPSRFDVIADIAVPSWWPHLTLDINAAWIGNWNDANGTIRQCASGAADCDKPRNRKIHVPLTYSLEGFNNLTEFILRSLGRTLPNQPTLARVYPSTLSACARDVTFLLEGANLWRGPRVFLSGIEMTEARVLPDMRGITIKGNLDDYFKLSADANRGKKTDSVSFLELTVATRDGIASAVLKVIGARGSADSCASPATLADGQSQLERDPDTKPKQNKPAVKVPAISGIAPLSVAACADQAQFVVSGKNLPVKADQINISLGGLPATIKAGSMSASGFEFLVDLPNDARKKGGGLNFAMRAGEVIYPAAGAAPVTVTVGACAS